MNNLATVLSAHNISIIVAGLFIAILILAGIYRFLVGAEEAPSIDTEETLEVGHERDYLDALPTKEELKEAEEEEDEYTTYSQR